MSEYTGKGKRWYDLDPILKEALELLKLSSDEILKLCTMFDCSPTKLQMLMKDPIFVAFCKENLKIENTDNNFTPDEM